MRQATACFVLTLGVILLSPAAVVAGELPPGGTFVDDDSNVHEADIEAIAAAGITHGCNPPLNDKYCPSDLVTRGQMAAFLVRALGLPAAEVGNLFVDDDHSIFEGDIDKLGAAGISKGCNPPLNTKFCPDDPVTRGQMAAFLMRALGLTVGSGVDLFVDDDDSIFEADIDRLGTAGVTKGCNPPVNDRYCPDDPVRRDQMASFLTRALGLEPMKPPPAPAGELTIIVLAVRQGSAALYEGPCGDVGLIDVNRFRGGDVLAALDELGTRKLAWISVSHYDADHLGDVVTVATSPGVTVGAVYDRGGPRTAKDSNTYRDYYDWVTAAGIRNPVDIGDSFTLCTGSDQVTFSIVSAGTDGTAAGGVPVTEENDRGLCLHVEYRNFDLATCGDINGVDTGSRTDVESAVAPAIGDVEVAIVNHHGSAFSSNPTYVNTLRAEAAIISVGKNSFGHPSPTVIGRWATHGDVYQTQDPTDNTLIDGDVTVTTNGTSSFAVASETGANVEYPLD